MATKREVRNQIKSTVSSDINKIRDQVREIKSLINRNISQDKKIRSDMNELSNTPNVSSKLDSIQSSLSSIESAISRLRSDINSLQSNMMNLQSSI
jgi:chromosome segregation ATPase